jgi:lysozyme
MTMKPSQACIDFIKSFESFYANAYLCPANVPTIGWGTTKWDLTRPVKLGERITRAEAERQLRLEVDRVAAAVNAAVRVPLSQNQFDALVSWGYNVGTGWITGRGHKQASFIKALNKRDYDAPVRDLPKFSRTTGGKQLSGLSRRRRAEVKMWQTGASASRSTSNESENASEGYVSRPSAAPYYDARFRQVQARLRALGYPVGAVDGLHGRASARGIAAFQRDHGLEGDAGVWYERYDDTLDVARSVIPEGRAATKTRQLTATDPLAKKLSWVEKILMWLGLSGGAAASLPDAASQATGTFSALSGVWQIIADNKALIIVAGFILAALLIRWVLTELRDAYRNNDYQGAIPSDEVRQ